MTATPPKARGKVVAVAAPPLQLWICPLRNITTSAAPCAIVCFSIPRSPTGLGLPRLSMANASMARRPSAGVSAEGGLSLPRLSMANASPGRRPSVGASATVGGGVTVPIADSQTRGRTSLAPGMASMPFLRGPSSAAMDPTLGVAAAAATEAEEPTADGDANADDQHTVTTEASKSYDSESYDEASHESHSVDEEFIQIHLPPPVVPLSTEGSAMPITSGHALTATNMRRLAEQVRFLAISRSCAPPPAAHTPHPQPCR